MSTLVKWVAAMVVLALGTPAFAGELTLRGSDATLHAMKALGAAYQQEKGVVVKVEGGGGGAGIKGLQAGEVQIAFLAREVKSAETGAGLVGTAYARDAVAVIVHKDNPTANVTAEELKKLFTGATAAWADGKPVVVLTRNKEANVREVLIDKVMGTEEITGKAQLKHAAIMIPTVEKLPGAIGYIAAGEIDAARIKALTINGVAPTPATIRDKSYLLTMSPSLVTKGAPSGDAKAFIDWVLSPKGQAVVAAEKLVPLGETKQVAEAK